MKQPFILITNDDGIYAPGIQYLWKSLHGKYRLAIAAPLTEKSGMSMAITMTRPLQIKEIPWKDSSLAWGINGTTADCVKLALSVILEQKPDLIVSGINCGSNSGRNILYSGTIGGVIEGALRGIPGIAFSSESHTDPKFFLYEKYIPHIVEHFLQNPVSTGSFINVTFPSNCKEPIQGFKMARQGRGFWTENPEKRLHPVGEPYYWLGGKWATCEEHKDSDVSLLKKGFITAVPLQVNELTDTILLKNQKVLFEDLFTTIEDPSQEFDLC